MKLTPSPKQLFLDDDGNPMVGGKVWTYEAGSTTPATTYQDYDGTENTNPIILDSRGEASIWLDEIYYKFELLDPDDNPIYTVNDISGLLAEEDSIGTAQLKDDAVTTAKIADHAVTYEKMQEVSEAFRLLGYSDGEGDQDVEEIPSTEFMFDFFLSVDKSTALQNLGGFLNLLDPRTTSISLGDAERGQLINFTTSSTTATLPLAVNAGNGMAFAIKNSATSGNVTITAGADKINGVVATYTLGPGDSVVVVSDGVDNWVTLASSSAQAGKVLQRVTSSTSAYSSQTGVIPFDDTIPQNTEGDELLTVSITPKLSSSNLVIEANIITGATTDGAQTVFALFKDSDTGAIYGAWTTGPLGVAPNVPFSFTVAAASTTARTYKLRVGITGGSSALLINGSAAARKLGGVAVSYLTVTEVAV